MSKLRNASGAAYIKKMRRTTELFVELIWTKGTKFSNVIEEVQNLSEVQKAEYVQVVVPVFYFDPETIFQAIVSLNVEIDDIVTVIALTLLRGTSWLDARSATSEFYSPAFVELIEHLIEVFNFPRQTGRCYQAKVLTPTGIFFAFPVLAAEVKQIIGSEADSLGVDMPFRYAFYGGASAIMMDKGLDVTMEYRLAMVEKYKEWLVRYCKQEEGREPTMKQVKRRVKTMLNCAMKCDMFEKKMTKKLQDFRKMQLQLHDMRKIQIVVHEDYIILSAGCLSMKLLH